MTKLKVLKKELKEAEKELKRNKNVAENKELISILKEEIKVKEHLMSKGHKISIYDKVSNKFEKYGPKIKYLDNIKYKGHNIVRLRFDEDKFNNNQNNYTINKVQNISNQVSQYLHSKNLNGKLMTTMRYGELGWRSGYFSDVGDDVELYEPNDSGLEIEKPKSIQSFVMYLMVNPKAEGGNDLNNDCLYNCLSKMIFNIDKYFKTPEALKKYLGLGRNDKVPCSPQIISKIEKKLMTYQINIRGDYIYTSTVKSEKVINLTLINEHYDIDKTFSKKPLCKFISFREKIPLLYDKVSFEAYDGKSVIKLSKEERNEILTSFKSPYILLNREERKDKQLTLIEEYNELIPIIERLKIETNGYVNLYKSGSYKNASLDLFDRFTKFMNEPEEILQDEALWIKEASTSALIWAEPYEGELYKYDVKSLYPHLMTLTTSKFPIKRGEFQQLKEFDLYFQFGIYRCIIEKSNNPNINKLFKFNKSNYYTSVSLNHAKSLGLNITLIHDSQPNFLYYSGDKTIKFSEVFDPFVKFMFDLKEKGIEKSKTILNMLWGALCEIDKRKYYDDHEINIDGDEEVFQLRPCKFNEDVDVIITNKINKRYKTNYARLCPFLLANGRFHMSKIMFDYKENIHRIQTDGFYSDKLIHQNIDVKLGELKYEGFNECGKIENCINKVPVHY